MENQPHASSLTDRKTLERNRRNHMKTLYTNLNSLIPIQNSKEAMPLYGQLEEATNYIKRLKNKLERLKEKKDQLMAIKRLSTSMNSGKMGEFRKPHIEIHDTGSALEVILVSEFESQFMFYEIIRVLQEEGADVVHANFSVVNETYFHTIHAEVAESTLGSGVAKIASRLRAYVHGSFNSL